jgi:4-diphosphocytidyl-2-C-methyl-D-erythritol kinase
MTRTARLNAYAKLNLGLRILYQRPDGYHELRTVFQTISLADKLVVSFTPLGTPAGKTRIRVDGTPHIPDNLVERAAHLVLAELGLRADVHFQLTKKIPSGAGLGGGSTDAAAVLLGLPPLAGGHIPEQRLFELAGQLGSDVPFFLHGGTALGLGRGEELYPLPDEPKTRALLVCPAIHSSTADAYRDLSAQLTSNALQNKLFSFQQQLWQQQGDRSLVNDFEGVVFARHPELVAIRDLLLSAGATIAAMTGSGSSVFGFFQSSEQLAEAKRLFEKPAFEKVQTFAISFVSRAQYRAAWRRTLASHIPAAPLKGNQWPPRSLYAQ